MVVFHGVSCFPENDAETKIIEDLSSQYLNDKLSQIDPDELKEFKSKLEKYLSGNEFFTRRESICVLDENIAKKVLPKYFQTDETDKRSLISVKELKQIAPGVYEIDGFAVFAHRYFRRSLSQFNNINDIFLKKLYDLTSLEGLDIKIALDPHSLGLLGTYKQPIELAYWWGPKFDESLTNIPLGVTQHKASKKDKFFSGIDSMDFWWHRQDNIQSLECEEIRDIATLGEGVDSYGCRYVHSMISDATLMPYHLDGAIRLYNEEKFIDRIGVDISKAGKDSRYIKLWRIDGEINISVWKELINDFFRDNYLVGEYFSGKNRDVDDVVEEKEDIPIYLPASMSPKDGVQISISYSKSSDYNEYEKDIIISACDKWGDNIEKFPVIDFTSINLLKLIKSKLKISIHIESETKYFAFDDTDVNFPNIICLRTDSVKNANTILECFKEDILNLYLSANNRLIAASFSVQYEDIMVRFSFAGNIQALKVFFESESVIFPSNFDEVANWMENKHITLKKLFTESNGDVFNKMLDFSGRFRIKREFLSSKHISLNSNNEIILKFHESEKYLVDMIQNHGMQAVKVIHVKSTECGNCNQEFMLCECVGNQKNDLIVKVNDGDLYGFVWTVRPA
ncbi:hypothetical protein [Acinetobacter haemolyticus]